MSSENTLSRRGFLGALTALGSISLSACATNSRQTSRVLAADRTAGQLPPRGEFVVRNAYVVTMDPQLGDIPRGDVHVRNGALVAVGPNLAAPAAEEIDGSNRIALPGFIDTHFHLWGSFARGIVADGDFDYFPVMSRIGPVMTPEDAYNSSKLGIAEADELRADNDSRLVAQYYFGCIRRRRFARAPRCWHPRALLLRLQP